MSNVLNNKTFPLFLLLHGGNIMANTSIRAFLLYKRKSFSPKILKQLRSILKDMIVH